MCCNAWFCLRHLKHRQICVRCAEEVVNSENSGPLRLPSFFTSENHMDIGDTFAELDALTDFEESIVSPVQSMVRVFTLYSTGMTEMRGHVVAVTQQGPQWVRSVPVRAAELGMLLVRRAPRDPARKQRVPFLANPHRLRAALKCLQEHNEAFQPGAVGSSIDSIQVNMDNLKDYPESGEAPDLQIKTIDQLEEFFIDKKLFKAWLSPINALELNTALLERMVLPELKRDCGDSAVPEDFDLLLDRAWSHVFVQHMRGRGFEMNSQSAFLDTDVAAWLKTLDLCHVTSFCLMY